MEQIPFDFEESSVQVVEENCCNIQKESLVDIENWFSYYPPKNDEQIRAYEQIREAGKLFAIVINQSTPKCADQTAAIRKIREAVMTANAAIACGGK